MVLMPNSLFRETIGKQTLSIYKQNIISNIFSREPKFRHEKEPNISTIRIFLNSKCPHLFALIETQFDGDADHKMNQKYRFFLNGCFWHFTPLFYLFSPSNQFKLNCCFTAALTKCPWTRFASSRLFSCLPK